MIKLRTRVGDAAPVSIVELVERPEATKPSRGKASDAATKPAAKAKAKAATKQKARTKERAAAKPSEKAAKPKRAAGKPKQGGAAGSSAVRKKPSSPQKKGS